MILIKFIFCSFILLLSPTEAEFKHEIIYSYEIGQGDPISRTQRNVKLDGSSRIGKNLPVYILIK